MDKFTGNVQTGLTTASLPVATTTSVTPAVPNIANQTIVGVLPTIKKSDGTSLVDYNQAVGLSNIKFTTGEPVLSLTDRYFVYEVVNLLNDLDYEVVFNFLSTDWIKVFGNVHDLRKKILFENPLMEPAREKLKMDMEIFRGKVDVGVGSVNCRRCNSTETISIESQTRSGDEMISVRVSCLQCGYKWQAQ